MHLLAQCMACGEVMNRVVSKDISLCMVEEDEAGDKADRWVCS